MFEMEDWWLGKKIIRFVWIAMIYHLETWVVRFKFILMWGRMDEGIGRWDQSCGIEWEGLLVNS